MIPQTTRDEIEKAFSLDSNLKSKKEFFKEVVEPAKVAAVKTFDPLLKPFSLELNNEDICQERTSDYRQLLTYS